MMIIKLKNVSLFLLSVLLLTIVYPAFNVNADTVLDTWTWVSGSDLDNQSPEYGELGLETLANCPGARQGSATWYDESNNYFWVFGGYGYDNNSNTGYLSDLWRYNFSTNMWSWIHGPVGRNYPAVSGTAGEFNETYIPSSRYLSTSWIDNVGQLWLFGGFDMGGYTKADLWCYNTSLNQWAWMAGSQMGGYLGNFGSFRVFDSSYLPPARQMSTSWVDRENNLFYIFGGQLDSSYGNDIWCYDPDIGQFAWYGGSSLTVQDGVYGTLGVEDDSSHPGTRTTQTSWYSGGYVYIFGGYGRSSSGATGRLNDLWRYNITSNKWTWMAGSDSTNSVGSYGTQDVFHSTNNPSARYRSTSCVGSEGNLYLFGGDAWLGTSGLLNDLWRYDLSLHQWAWISGNNTLNAAGSYGDLGVGNSSTWLGARQRTSIHCDSNGFLWVFGGNGYDSEGSLGMLNDLWIYVPFDLVIIPEFHQLGVAFLIICGTFCMFLVIRKRKRI